MGQFLDFSCVHSSTVTLVRNLHTGHISPQYPVVFDDNFETVFNEGRSNEEVDIIYDSLFEGNCECYVEEEHDQDGVLSYEPPQLDEVWLSKPYTLDCLDSLKRQNCITKRRQKLHSEEVRRSELKGKRSQ